jgi:hypothetical protein
LNQISNKSNNNNAKQDFFKKKTAAKNGTYHSDVTSSEDDVTTTDDNVTTTNSDVSNKTTPKKGVRCKTPDPNQDLGVMTLGAVEPATKICLEEVPNSP